MLQVECLIITAGSPVVKRLGSLGRVSRWSHVGPSTTAICLPPVAGEMLYTATCAVDVSSSAEQEVLEEDSREGGRCTTASARGVIQQLGLHSVEKRGCSERWGGAGQAG